MNKKLLAPLIALGLLAGCATTPDPEPGAPTVTPVQVPQLPAYFNEKYERLPDIVERTLRAQIDAGVESDRAYNDVSTKYNELVDFYNCIEKAVNEKEDPEQCLSE